MLFLHLKIHAINITYYSFQISKSRDHPQGFMNVSQELLRFSHQIK